MNNKDVAVVNTKQVEELIDELKYLEAKLLPQFEGDSSLFKNINNMIEKLRDINQNIEKRIEYALENNPHGIDFKYDVRFVKYALLTDLESIKDVLHVARKLDDRDFIVWIFNQVNMIKPEWSKDLKLGSVPFMKENDEAMRRFNEISSKTIKERYPKPAE